MEGKLFNKVLHKQVIRFMDKKSYIGAAPSECIFHFLLDLCLSTDSGDHRNTLQWIRIFLL